MKVRLVYELEAGIPDAACTVRHMKISTASVVSALGVLLTGTAAFAFNTAVLTPASSVPATLLPTASATGFSDSQATFTPGVQSEAPLGQVEASDARPPALEAGTSGAPVAPLGTSANQAERVFKLGVLGSITVRATDSAIEVVSIDSTWDSSVTNTSKGIIVKLSKDGRAMAFNASLAQGEIKASVVDLTPASQSTTPRQGSATTQRPPRDSDRDSEDEGEDHEDDEESHGEVEDDD